MSKTQFDMIKDITKKGETRFFRKLLSVGYRGGFLYKACFYWCDASVTSNIDVGGQTLMFVIKFDFKWSNYGLSVTQLETKYLSLLTKVFMAHFDLRIWILTLSV